jgi:type IV fimbrial biogenesis protein FimT
MEKGRSMKAKALPRRAKGITLVEMLAVMSIASILTAIAVPNLSGFVVNNRLGASANELVTTLSLARSEAILRGAPVVLRRTSATEQDWSGGWEVFVDLDGNGERNTAAGSEEVLLRAGGSMNSPLSVFSSTAAADGIRFMPNGRVRPLGTGAAMFMICYDGLVANAGRPFSRAVLVSDSGRIRVAATDASGYPLNDAAAAVTSCTAPG